jgi:predicted nucleic acid-binding protein
MEIQSRGNTRAPMSLAFFDANVLVYTDDASDLNKQSKASAVFKKHFVNRTAVLSLQVLQEYFAIVTRKLHCHQMWRSSAYRFSVSPK